VLYRVTVDGTTTAEDIGPTLETDCRPGAVDTDVVIGAASEDEAIGALV